MTSSGPATQSLLFSHMYEKKDTKPRFVSGKKLYNPNSIMGVISLEKEFSIVCYMIKFAKLDGILNDIEANFTLIIPSDSALLAKYPKILFTNMDRLTCRTLILSSMLDRRMTTMLLTASPAAYFTTKDPGYNKLMVTNISNTCVFNNIATLTEVNNISCDNGLIHTTDDFVIGTEKVIV